MAEKAVLTAWSATRSGVAMTLTGKDARGVVRRIVNVATIGVENGHVIARTRDGDAYRLAAEDQRVTA